MTINQDTLINYVMGALTPEEEREIASYLKENPDDAVFVRDLFETMAEVALELEPAPVADNAAESLLARIRKQDASEPSEGQGKLDLPKLTLLDKKPEAAKKPESQERKVDHYKIDDDFFERSSQIPQADISGRGQKTIIKDRAPIIPRWLTGLAAAAAIATFVYLGFRPETDPVMAQLNSLCKDEGTVCSVLNNDANEVVGEFAKRPNNALFVVLKEMPPEGQVYQAWEIVEGTPQSLGVWQDRVLDIATPLGKDSIFGVSIEPAGGSESPTNVITLLPLAS